MPYADPEKRRAYQKAYGHNWYLKHREEVIERVKQRKHTDYAGTCINCGGPTVGSSLNNIPQWCAKPECKRARYKGLS